MFDGVMRYSGDVHTTSRAKRPRKIRNGVPLFVPKRGAKKPNLTLVNKLRDDA
jgi:hypothetical protein